MRVAPLRSVSDVALAAREQVGEGVQLQRRFADGDTLSEDELLREERFLARLPLPAGPPPPERVGVEA
jgi:hypothetical protein